MSSKPPRRCAGEPSRRRVSIGASEERGSEGTFDRVFDLVGTGETTELAGRLVKRQGRIVIIGEEAEYPRIDTIAIAQREIEIVGSRNGSRADAERALALMASGVIRPRIADRIGLEGINDALETMRAGRLHGRVIVEFPQ